MCDKTNKTSPFLFLCFPKFNFQMAPHLLGGLCVPRGLVLLGVRVLDPPVDGEAEHPRVPEGGAVELGELGPVLGELGPGGGGQDQGVHPHTVPRGLETSESGKLILTLKQAAALTC